MKYAMVIDQQKCVGCGGCILACKAENNTPGEINWCDKITETRGTFPNVSYEYISTMCNHCDDAPCVNACPTRAMYKTPEGLTLHDPDKCIGSGTCANLCPTHVIQVINQGSLRTVRKAEIVFGEQPLERCQGCGKLYATEKQVDLAEKRTGPHPHVKHHHHYCPACAKLFSDRLQVIKKQPPKQRFNRT